MDSARAAATLSEVAEWFSAKITGRAPTSYVAHASYMATLTWKRLRACTVGRARSRRMDAMSRSIHWRAIECAAGALEGIGEELGVTPTVSEGEGVTLGVPEGEGVTERVAERKALGDGDAVGVAEGSAEARGRSASPRNCVPAGAAASSEAAQAELQAAATA